MTITATGALEADGSVSTSQLLSPNSGAGSGGSVSIIARTLLGHGNISVAGGDALGLQTGAAGGGGRIYIHVSLIDHSD